MEKTEAVPKWAMRAAEDANVEWSFDLTPEGVVTLARDFAEASPFQEAKELAQAVLIDHKNYYGMAKPCGLPGARECCEKAEALQFRVGQVVYRKDVDEFEKVVQREHRTNGDVHWYIYGLASTPDMWLMESDLHAQNFKEVGPGWVREKLGRD